MYIYLKLNIRNLEDYLSLFNAGNTSIRDDLPVTNNQLPISSSTTIIAERNSNNSRSEDSQRNSLSKYLSSPEHFPSFNVNILGSDSESSQNVTSKFKVKLDLVGFTKLCN